MMASATITDFQDEADHSVYRMDDAGFANHDETLGLIFDPPVFKQRYGQVSTVLSDAKWQENIKKVVDFGCAEMGLFTFMKHAENIHEILLVDIDEDTLVDNLYRVRPLPYDYLTKRESQLIVEVYQGSVADPNAKLLDCDAVTAIELIEHLFPDCLEAFSYNVFSYISPKLVIVTTPNADFNVLFDKQGFRHYDHKFEWTRAQFEEWAINITSRFPTYTAHFSGIGSGPRGTEAFGCCSQMAVFIRNDVMHNKNEKIPAALDGKLSSRSETQPDKSFGICTYMSKSKIPPNSCSEDNFYFKLIERIEYPFKVDNRTSEEKLLHVLEYKINSQTYLTSRFYNEESDRYEIPLREIMYDYMEKEVCSLSELKDILKTLKYEIEECAKAPSLTSISCVVVEANSPWSDDDEELDDEYVVEESNSPSQTANIESWSDSEELAMEKLNNSPPATSWDEEPPCNYF